MTILACGLLTPNSANVSSPLKKSLLSFENYLIKKASGTDELIARRYKKYLESCWHQLKELLVLRILGCESRGPAILSLISKAPDEEFIETASVFLRSLNYSRYYSSDLWRAFYYWLSHDGQLNPRWPLAEKDEMEFLFCMVPAKELQILEEDAQKEWPNFFENKKGVDLLFKKIQPALKEICRSKLFYLSKHDPATYAMEDLLQELNCSVLSSLQACDYYHDDPEHMITWAKRCARNAIENLREYANAESRACLFSFKKEDGGYSFTPRMKHLVPSTGETDSTSGNLVNEDMFIADDYSGSALDSASEFETNNFINSVEDCRVAAYLKLVWGQEHDPLFWAWFEQHQPQLACRPIYLQENPEAIGPWVQRWLGLKNSDLLYFLKTYLPDILETVEQRKTKRDHLRMAKGA